MFTTDYIYLQRVLKIFFGINTIASLHFTFPKRANDLHNTALNKYDFYTVPNTFRTSAVSNALLALVDLEHKKLKEIFSWRRMTSCRESDKM